MKPAAEWINRVGEATMLAAFAGQNPPGIEVEKVIREIQINVLEHVMATEGIGFGGQDCVFKETIKREIDKLRSMQP